MMNRLLTAQNEEIREQEFSFEKFLQLNSKLCGSPEFEEVFKTLYVPENCYEGFHWCCTHIS